MPGRRVGRAGQEIQSMSEPEDIEIACEIKHETDAAYLIFDGKTEVWVPKSKISDYGMKGARITSIFIPEWMADQKGLL